MLGMLVAGRAMAGRSVAGSAMAGSAVVRHDIGDRAAFGVFHGFQITNLDGFFRCHIVFFRSCSSFCCGCFCQPQWTAKETALIRTVRLSFTFLVLRAGALVLALLVDWAVMLAVSAFSVFFGF